MKKRILSVISAAAVSFSAAASMPVIAADETPYTVTVTLLDDEMGELFREETLDKLCIEGIGHVGDVGGPGLGGGAHVDVGSSDPGADNPITYTNLDPTFNYIIRYIGRSYDGYSYGLNHQKCKSTFNFTESENVEITLYVKKTVWGNTSESTTAPSTEPTVPTETTTAPPSYPETYPKNCSFNELLTMTEEELENYCLSYNIAYIPAENAAAEMRYDQKISVLLDPSSFLKDGFEDVTVSGNISDLKQYNCYDYNYEDMVAALDFPEELYDLSSVSDYFNFSVRGEFTGGENVYRKLAEVPIKIKNYSSPNAVRLYQLIWVWSARCEQFDSIHVEYSGGISPAVQDIAGDVNGDGKVSAADAVMLGKWLLGSGTMNSTQNADLCKDGRIDAYDLVMLREMLIK